MARLGRAVLCAAALGLLGAGAAEARTEVEGRWVCETTGLGQARVELWRHRPLLSTGVPADVRLSRGWTAPDGRFSLSASARAGDELFVRVALRDRSGVHVVDAVTGEVFTDSPRVPADRAVQSLRRLDFTAALPCAVFQGFQAADREYRDRVGRTRPYDGLGVRVNSPLADLPQVGVPFTAHTVVRWPSGLAANRATIRHEFGHVVRHALDGNALHFLADVREFGYTRQHQPCLKTNLGYAFNEGWAEFWGGDFAPAPNCPGVARADFEVEGNVAVALDRLRSQCGADRRALVDVLRRGRGEIHSWAEFRTGLVCRGAIVRQRGMVGVRLGMTQPEVVELLGPPDATTTSRSPIFGTSTIARYRAYGVRVIYSDGRNGPAQVTAISTDSEKVRTAAGVGVGSSSRGVRADVRGARCETFYGGRRSCYVGSFRPGTIVTDFQLGRGGTVRGVTIGYVID